VSSRSWFSTIMISNSGLNSSCRRSRQVRRRGAFDPPWSRAFYRSAMARLPYLAGWWGFWYVMHSLCPGVGTTITTVGPLAVSNPITHQMHEPRSRR
jgi:hypothetical protein